MTTMCQECGMLVENNEYHPYAACLMFKSCKDNEMVRGNLISVRNHAVDYCAMVADGCDKNTHPSDLADMLRGLKKDVVPDSEVEFYELPGTGCIACGGKLSWDGKTCAKCGNVWSDGSG